MNNTVNVADRKDYVISTIGNEIPPLSGLQNYSVSLDTDYPWVWFGFYIGSIYSTTVILGDTVFVQPTDLSFQLKDSNQSFLFSFPMLAGAIEYAVTSSNIPTNDNKCEIFPIYPQKPQPAGGAIYMTASNLNAFGNIGFDIVFCGYKQKTDCMRTQPTSPMRNARLLTDVASGPLQRQYNAMNRGVR